MGNSMASPILEQDKQSRLKTLIAKGKEQGYLTYAEVNDHLTEGIVDASQIKRKPQSQFEIPRFSTTRSDGPQAAN